MIIRIDHNNSFYRRSSSWREITARYVKSAELCYETGCHMTFCNQDGGN